MSSRSSIDSAVPSSFSRHHGAHHPAFGGDFLDGSCKIATNATRFTNDPEAIAGLIEPGSVHVWPTVAGRDGPIDLADIPDGPSRKLLGWLSDFDGAPWASITNERLGLTARLDWDGTVMPYAWFWQELEWTAMWPWFRRARVAAIEPSSVPTSGPLRESAPRLAGGGTIAASIALTVNESSPTSRGPES